MLCGYLLKLENRHNSALYERLLYSLLEEISPTGILHTCHITQLHLKLEYAVVAEAAVADQRPFIHSQWNAITPYLA